LVQAAAKASVKIQLLVFLETSLKADTESCSSVGLLRKLSQLQACCTSDIRSMAA